MTEIMPDNGLSHRRSGGQHDGGARTVRISMPTVKGKEVILGDLHPGELFGETAMLGGKPLSANATALIQCELLGLERRNIIPFLEKHLSL